ncbi:sensor histidine kinase [Waterburya agarophytonicola]|nr:HAMP domain-containing sensor histidine kinase [Waterburya agarophytonicola]
MKFTYDFRSIDLSLERLSQKQYSAILYDYFSDTNSKDIHSLREKIQWLCHLYPCIPLILITDPLGDKQAVDMIQLGVDGYILRRNISQLPDILEKTLFNFLSKQAIVTQQEDLIRQQHQKIEQLEREKQSWLKQTKTKQEYISHQNKRIEQLEQEKQSWLSNEKAKQEHISHLNHELRSPISSIVGFARMLKEQYYGSLNEKQLQYAAGILSSAEHLLALVKNYLDIVKIDAQKQKLELEKLSVGEICQAAMFIVKEKAQQKGLNFSLDLDKNIDFCTADSLRLKQVLINLLSNAIKFTDRGSITLQVRLKDQFLYFAVIDTGTGISAKNMTKLFKPFPQITSHHESTGLGLTLSRKLAQLHGGDIIVTSELGKGSCFTLSIPQYQ